MRLFFQTICRTGIFMICAQAVVHFRAQESYEKYLKLLVSAMVLVQLFLPLGSLLSGIGAEGTLKRLESFRESLEQSMEEAQRKAEETDRLLERMTLEEVQRRMEEQAAREGQAAGEEQGKAEGEAAQKEPGDPEEIPAKPQGLQTEDVAVELEDIEIEVAPVEPISGSGAQ